MKNRKRILAAILTAIMTISILPANSFASEAGENDTAEAAVEAVSVSDEEQEVESTVEDISEETASETEEEPSVIDEAEEDSEPETTEEVEAVVEEEDLAAEEAEETVEADEVVETVEDDIETVDTESEGPRTLKAEGKDYIVTVTYNDSALLPDDVKIAVEEIKENARKYDSYCDGALEAVQKENDEAEEISYIRLFDITLVDGEGHKVQPETAVDVQIRLKDIESVEENTQVVHFAGKEEKPEVIEPAIDNDTVAFEAEGFSIYAVVTSGEYARLTVNFNVSEGNTTTMYVKQKDITDDNLNQVLYDPGVPVQDGKKFLGWTDNASWTNLSIDELKAEAMTIDDVREAVTTRLNAGVTDGDFATYYAIMVNCFELYYQDEYNNTFKTENVLSTSNSGTTTVECLYTLTGGSATESFIGWKVMDTESPVYKNGDPITITKDTTLVPEVGEGKWIYFDENDGGSGGGASYTRPVFVPAGELATNYKPADPTRPGYTFAGWYKGVEDNAQKYEFDTNLKEFPADSPVTLYAHWTPNGHASYKVIIWKQKVTDDKNAADADKTYDYLESHTIEEVATDTPITAEALSQYLSYGNEELGVTDLEHGSYGFKTPARYEIENGSGADGNGVRSDDSTVVNVYYDRAMFSVIFNGLTGSEDNYIPVDSITGTEAYGLINGEYVQLDTQVEKYILWYTSKSAADLGNSSGREYTTISRRVNSQLTNVSVSDINLSNASIETVYQYLTTTSPFKLTNTSSGASVMYAEGGSGSQLYARVKGRNTSYSYNGEPYEGQIYQRTQTLVYTGLYGQSFKDADTSYTWRMPDETHRWNHVSYLNAFTGNLYGHSNTGNNPNVVSLERTTETNNFTIIFWEQNTDLSSYTQAATAGYTCGENDGFNITDRIMGMVSAGYRWSTSSAQPTTWNSTAQMVSETDGINSNGYTNVKRGSNTYLHIKYDRALNDIVYMYGTEELGRVEDIAYGQSLAAYQNTTPDTSSIEIPEHEYLAGWYDNPEGVGDPYDWSEKMPLGNKLIYAITKPVQYHVIVEMDGGEVQNQSTDFRVSYGTTIADTNFMQATKTVGGSNYSLVGYYTDEAFTDLWNFSSKVTADSLRYTYTGPDDQMRETYGDVGRDQTVGIFKLFARWRNDDILKQGGLNIRYRNPDASSENLYVDSMHYADLSDVIAAQAPEEAVWPKDKRFDGWQLTEGKVYQPGDVFVADSDDAVIESGKYWITLTAVYVDKEDRTPTHVTWYKNYAEDGVYGYYHTDDDYSINAGINIYGPPTRTGYEFLGWAKATEKESADAPVTHIDATTPNFLAFKEGKFYLVENGTTTDKVVTQIAADEFLPYEALYAVWQKDQFLIYHSSTGQTEYVDMPESGKFDITEKVATNMLYGGYYEYDENATNPAKKGDAITKNPGTSMVPEKGHIYYLKEVDARYLRPAVYLTWSEIHNGLIRNLYGFVDIDTQDDYTDAGLDIGGEEFPIWGEGKLTNGTITVTKQGEGQENDILTATSLFTIDNAVFGYTDLNSKISGGARLLINGYYKTKDGVKVTGYKTRVIQFAANDPAYGAPVFTGWNSNGNTVCGLASVKPSYTPVSRSLTAGKFTLMRSLSINVPADKLEYTITKVYDSGVDLQAVEEGDHTGEITYAEKSGYYFAGWYKDGAFTEPADFSDINSDLTVYAKYVKASDISASFSRKSSKSGTTTFNAVVAVKGKSDLADVSVMVNGKNASVLGNASVKKTGSGKNVKYTTQYKGTAAVSGLSLISSFTASVSWTTADGTAVAGPAYKCTYILGLVTVK